LHYDSKCEDPVNLENNNQSLILEENTTVVVPIQWVNETRPLSDILNEILEKPLNQSDQKDLVKNRAARIKRSFEKMDSVDLTGSSPHFMAGIHPYSRIMTALDTMDKAQSMMNVIFKQLSKEIPVESTQKPGSLLSNE
jgi:hypothetical protein